MLDFLMHLTRPDGTPPMLGDNDGGRALALDQRDYRSFQVKRRLGATLYRRGVLRRQAVAFCEGPLWMGGEGWNTWREVPSRQPAETQAYYPCAGYLVQRSGWGPLASHTVFDCGGFGILTGGQSNADALSDTLFCRRSEMLVYPGTFIYNCAPPWRHYCRSSAAHHTVTIDGQDQAQPDGAFRWRIGGRADIPIESTRLKLIREGQEDYEHLALLEKLPVSQSAGQYADRMVKKPYLWESRPEVFLEVRRELGEALDRAAARSGNAM